MARRKQTITVFFLTFSLGAFSYALGYSVGKNSQPANFTNDTTVTEMNGNPTNIPTNVDSLEELVEKETPEVTEESTILDGDTRGQILMKKM